MHKRPALRPRQPPIVNNERVRIEPGTFLYDLLKFEPTQGYKYVPTPIYNKAAYLSLMKINCKKMGIPYEEPKNIPDSIVVETPPVVKEKTIDAWDRVYINLKILKNGTIRVKLNAQFYEMYEKYTMKNKRTPIKPILQAYKSMGFSDDFLKNLLKKYDEKVRFGKKIEKVLDTIFNKEPVKKPKKKKEEVIEEPEQEDERDDEDADDAEDADDGLDVEVEPDDDEVQDQTEEMFFSDED